MLSVMGILGFGEKGEPERSARGSYSEGRVMNVLGTGGALPLLCFIPQHPTLPGSLASHLPSGADQWEALPETGSRREQKPGLPPQLSWLFVRATTVHLLPADGKALL